MSYLIKSVGIDLAPVSMGIATTATRSGTWIASILDAGVFHMNRNPTARVSQFKQHLYVAKRITEYVKKQKPDIVGIEDYTMQSNTFVGFSMGQLGGMVRLMLWQEGYRCLLITPQKLIQYVVPVHVKRNKGNEWKKYCVKWVERVFNQELGGNAKERSDMADASIYSLMASCFFAYYWMRVHPPLTAKQREAFFNIPPREYSAMWKKGWKPAGLMDTPHRYLIRNYDKEPETYTPEWLKGELPKEVEFVE
jgi:Holliday junction resolvasome RuvABC endonuclease subunit